MSEDITVVTDDPSITTPVTVINRDGTAVTTVPREPDVVLGTRDTVAVVNDGLTTVYETRVGPPRTIGGVLVDEPVGTPVYAVAPSAGNNASATVAPTSPAPASPYNPSGMADKTAHELKWETVDNYIVEHMLPYDADLEWAQASSNAANLPAISVTANQGRLLQLLASLNSSTRILEIGTLGGYSTIWLARALKPGGRLITLEAEAHHAVVAEANIKRAGLGDVVDVRLGKAIDLLPGLELENVSPFDFIFIDADKDSMPEYYDWAIRLSRPGTIIVCDNVVRNGEVVNAAAEDLSVQGVRRFFDRIKTDDRVTATAIQTVGSKGYDGFAIIQVKPAVVVDQVFVERRTIIT